ncbi:hypothetical protein HFK89_24835 [Ralstonia pseudosolanacearum]|uniref:hypothetical protein n=2 Tax=Ralstonia pseudosolanacearum TaxID=1310165 RepID=UPI0008F9632E|nr:hypothetical protein [Ralstonia pseudosolanacearum]MCK4165569.1 hypothetical protein [Ralstonia pseudosolanacearum]OIN68611.1 hypothetical protein BL248_23645 [Ralstonia solanacearum]
MTGAFNNYDLFAAIGGITVAGVCSLGAVGTALFGFKRFRLPYDTKDGFPRGIANFLLFVPFILCFIFITPQNGKLVTLIALIGVPVGMFCFAQYNIAFRNHRFTKPVPSGWMIWKRDREEIIVGGKVLTKNARDRIAQTGKSEQETLAEAAYNPDEIWERSSRTSLQLRIEIWFYAFLLSSVIPVVVASLALQAVISNTAPVDAASKLWGHP